MEKYGTEDVHGQQRAELEGLRIQLELLRGFPTAPLLNKEAASSEIRRLEERERELVRALAAAD